MFRMGHPCCLGGNTCRLALEVPAAGGGVDATVGGGVAAATVGGGVAAATVFAGAVGG